MLLSGSFATLKQFDWIIIENLQISYLCLSNILNVSMFYFQFYPVHYSVLLSESPTIISNRAETFTGPTILIQLSLHNFQIWIFSQPRDHNHVIHSILSENVKKNLKKETIMRFSN